MSQSPEPKGPDFSKGIATDRIKEGGMLGGHVGKHAVLIARVDGVLYAVDAECTHYHGPLAEGLIVNGTVRCPWHHACFDLKTGEAVAAPAIDPLKCWAISEENGQVIVRAKGEAKDATVTEARQITRQSSPKQRVVIIGGGAAGFATAELLHRKAFGGTITVISDDRDAPYDRPNCSKDYLAGTAPKAWMPLRDSDFYKESKIDLRIKTEVASFDTKSRTVTLGSGETLPYDVLILATGAEPQRPALPGLDRPNVFTLRTFADAEALLEAVKRAKRVAVIGASFIGLEVAGSLRQQGLEVHVIAPDTTPLEKIMGKAIGSWIQGVHEAKGVHFRLGVKVKAYQEGKVMLEKGESIAADFVVLGTGVKPRTALAETAGLKVDNGVITDDHLLTSAPGVYAAGDIARYPDPISGRLIRVEHWVHAERQGQYLARLILGADEPFSDPPYFWSNHYDKSVSYSGHAERFDAPEIEGSVTAEDATVRYRETGRVTAVATVGRDLANLQAELGFERESGRTG